MAAWKMKENRALKSGRAVTLEYEGRELAAHIPSYRDFNAAVSAYGQRLVAIVEDTKKAEQHAEQIAQPDESDPAQKAPCGCLGKAKTLGILSLGKALLSGRASPELAARRLALCRACQATDPTGERLFRMTDGKAYCGIPRLLKIYRDERSWGCGCDLGWKTRMADAGCPVGVW